MFLLIIGTVKKILSILLFGKQIMVLHTIITITFLIAMNSKLLNLRQLYNTISNITVPIYYTVIVQIIFPHGIHCTYLHNIMCYK